MDQISGKPSPHESLLSKRKDAIIAKSMAVLEQHIDQWLENGLKPMKRPAKRAREDTDSGAEDNHAVAERGNSKAAQKRTKRELVRRFACPFAKHNPAEFKNVKTCCGPGWNDVHRVKEHVYRRHSLKNACNRCFEFFKDAKGLKEHQRAATPCRLKEDAPTDIINDKQEELLRTRAKAGSSAESNWQEMYRVIFPDAKAPSPYYDSTDSEIIAKAEEHSRFKDLDECKGFVKREFLRAVKPVLVAEVERVLQVLDTKIVQKATDIFRDFETRISRTWQFQSEQSSLVDAPATPDTPETEPDLEPDLGQRVSVAGPDFSPIFGALNEDPMTALWSPEGGFNWESFLGGGGVQGVGCGVAESLVNDSAYFTSSLDEGGSESYYS